MTIVPAHHNLPSNYQGPPEQLPQISVKDVGFGYSVCAPAGSDCYHHGVGSNLAMVNLPMAEHESPVRRGDNLSDEALASGSKGFRDRDEEDEGWLQLSIGVRTCRDHNGRNKSGDGHDRSISASRGLVELDLLTPGRGSGAGMNKLEANSSTVLTIGPDTAIVSPPLLFHHQYGSGPEFPHRQLEINNWGFRPAIHGRGFGGGDMVPTSSNSSYPSSLSSSLPRASPYFGRPLHLGGADRAAGPSSTDVIKIIDPPQRLNLGIWFMLLASQNQAEEASLPQIPKTYLRVKDGRMTVRLLTKYLVNKLKLDHELEIEITCRGQELQPYLTLQHVRDNLWIPRKDSSTKITTTSAQMSRTVALRPESTTTTTQQHLMVLRYSRRRRRITTPTALS